MPEMRQDNDLPHNYRHSADHAYQLDMLKALPPEPDKDVLCLTAEEGAELFNAVNEDDEIFLDDIMDISKPKGFAKEANRPIREVVASYLASTVATQESIPVERPPVIHSGPVSTFEYLLVAPSYQEIEESEMRNVRVQNLPLHISSKTKKVLEGVTRAELLDSVTSHFDLRPTRGALSANTYLYCETPPPYSAVQAFLPNSRRVVQRSESLVAEARPHAIQVTLLYLEVYPETRLSYLPDPAIDPVVFVACKLRNDMDTSEEFMIEVGSALCRHSNKYACDILSVPSEEDLLEYLSSYIAEKCPDFLLSFESEKLGVGYLVKRARVLNVFFNLSRFSINSKKKSTASHRMNISVWRIIKSEVSLPSFTFHSAIEAVFGVRVPEYSWETLRKYWQSARYLVYDYVLERLHLSVKAVNKYQVFSRNIGLAKTFRIDLYSVFTRGSQYRVECVLKELTRDYLLLSAMPEQLRKQRMPESIPLVLEPERGFWTDPVVILDFQSLYPSIMIAYNLCFSTCLGKLSSSPYKRFGLTHMKREMFAPGQDVFITPNNVAFVTKDVRHGAIPQMMFELLQSRILIKKYMKTYAKGSESYWRLYVQQLGIKLLCNTTYGYTGAGISGRMPCTDIADSIVAVARRTLEAAIMLVNNHPTWGARTIYGDTDSLMVLLPGRSVAEAHRIGREIADTVTNSNPAPVTLLFEKVGCPMLTLAKKHYAVRGFDTPESPGVFEAKGIHSVRKNSCLLTSHILEGSLKVLFDTCDVSALYGFLTETWTKIFKGAFPLNFYIFSQPVELGTYKNPPPAVRMIEQEIEKDPMKEPLSGERISYVVISGKPGDGMLEHVVRPEAFLTTPNMHIHFKYYIHNHVNHIIEHSIGLIGINVHKWYEKFQKPTANYAFGHTMNSAAKIDAFYNKAKCIICSAKSHTRVCDSCKSNSQAQALASLLGLQRQEERMHALVQTCQQCCGVRENVACLAVGCPVLYERVKAKLELAQTGGTVLNEIAAAPMIN